MSVKQNAESKSQTLLGEGGTDQGKGWGRVGRTGKEQLLGLLGPKDLGCRLAEERSAEKVWTPTHF